MANKMISICDGCRKEGTYNHNYSKPNDWIGCKFECKNRSIEHEFCSKECLKNYIDSESMGNDIGHEIKELANSDEVGADE